MGRVFYFVHIVASCETESTSRAGLALAHGPLFDYRKVLVMELLSRPKNDRYTRPGEYHELERRLHAHADVAEIPVLVCYAFDQRTRLGPFLYADPRLLTAG